MRVGSESRSLLKKTDPRPGRFYSYMNILRLYRLLKKNKVFSLYVQARCMCILRNILLISAIFRDNSTVKHTYGHENNAFKQG